jgi:hypothetical protein
MAKEPAKPQPKDGAKPTPGSGLPDDFYKVLGETGSLDQAMGRKDPKPKS